jgi:hypothetical protein
VDENCTTGTVNNLDLSTQVGQQFIFEQDSSDGCCGRATLVISDINGVIAAPPSALRQTSNLSFDQSQYGSDTLSDPDGQLRKTLDSINAKYGNLLK